MRLVRPLLAAPLAAAGLLIATAAPAGARLACASGGCATFTERGSAQAFTVPTGVVGVTAELFGAGGGAGYDEDGSTVSGGFGGLTVAALSTTPGSTLEVVAGGAGGDASEPTITDPYDPDSGAGAAGYNGGGAGSSNPDGGYAGGGGGGSTEIFIGTATTPALVAGGGGGGAGSQDDLSTAGGDGGGSTGSSGSAAESEPGGGGGTSSGPGAGGGKGADVGTAGATTGGGGSGDHGGGGGGAGYYGGGGGGDDGDNDGTGGGGGSGYMAAGSAGTTLQGAGEPDSADGFATVYWMTAPTLTLTAGDSITLTADVPFGLLSAAGGHSGAILTTSTEGTETFTVGSTTLCSAVAASDGTASCSTSALPVGTDDVTATLSAPEPAAHHTVPGSAILDSDLVGRAGPGSAGLDAGSPWTGTTEVLAVHVSAVPVPESGAGLPAEVPPIAAVLILAGAAGIVATRRRRPAR